MLVAGLLDAGAPEDALRLALDGLPQEFRWRRERATRHSIAGERFVVEAREGHVHRHLSDVLAILSGTALGLRARRWAERAFRLLAEAEARCHDSTPEEVHFHEVGAVDAIVDIAGACALLDALDPEGVWASPVAVGSGFARCAHGRMPVPVPAVAELLRGVPTCGEALDGERTTPTGAALLRAWDTRFTTRPPAAAERIGYGAGARDPGDVPNLLRVVVEEASGEGEILVELRTLVDDRSGEVIGAALDAIHRAGAVEAFATAAWAKKGRPAFEVCVLCAPEQQPDFEELLFRHLGTLGMRTQAVARSRRPRAIEVRDTALGALPHKVRSDPQGSESTKPEFEALSARAAELGLTPREALRILEAEARDVEDGGESPPA